LSATVEKFRIEKANRTSRFTIKSKKKRNSEQSENSEDSFSESEFASGKRK
jgi:hypothetical protein